MLGNTCGRKRSGYVPDYVVFDLETTGTNANYIWYVFGVYRG